MLTHAHWLHMCAQKGAMNCIISSEILDVEQLKDELAKVPSMAGLELASVVSTERSLYERR